MKFRKIGVLVASAVLSVGSALAHHSQRTFYNLDETVEFTGVVKSFVLRNPHPEIVLEVTDPEGSTVEMRVYAEATAGMMMQGGWTSDSIAAGDTITVVGNLARSGDGSMMGASVRISSGDVLTMRMRELIDFGAPAPQ